MAVCSGIKRTGGRCTVSVPEGQQFCHHHDPARAGERRRAASRAGRSRGSTDVRALKQRISDLVEGVLDGSVDRGRAAVAVQGLNALRGALELERRTLETDELMSRVEELERVAGTQEADGGRPA